MNINNIIEQCIKIPGISLKQSEYSTELILKEKEGKGSMTFYPLFPGLTIAYIFVNSPKWKAPEFHKNSSMNKGLLLFNYCVTGRCELILNNENFVYVKDGEISLTEHFAQEQYVYPRRIYEGLEYFIDIETIETQSPWIKEEFKIDFCRLADVYCPDGKTYISPASPEVEDILKKMWLLLDFSIPFAVSQMKSYTLVLFSQLLNMDNIPPSQACTFLTETQVDIAKRAAQIITSDLRQHHPAWELAEQFSISETSLKNYFRSVFGQNISVYLREARMNKAAELLAATKLSIAEISGQVGYLNQSKFASVFKKQFSKSPLDYRRAKKLESL